MIIYLNKYISKGPVSKFYSHVIIKLWCWGKSDFIYHVKFIQTYKHHSRTVTDKSRALYNTINVCALYNMEMSAADKTNII